MLESIGIGLAIGIGTLIGSFLPPNYGKEINPVDAYNSFIVCAKFIAVPTFVFLILFYFILKAIKDEDRRIKVFKWFELIFHIGFILYICFLGLFNII